MTPQRWMQIAHSCREREWIRHHNDTIHSGARAHVNGGGARGVRVPPHRLQQGDLRRESEEAKKKHRAWCKTSFQSWGAPGTATFTRTPIPVTWTRHACHKGETVRCAYIMMDHENNHHQINLMRRFNDAGSRKAARAHTSAQWRTKYKYPLIPFLLLYISFIILTLNRRKF